jgi:hypothetical protein
MARWLFMSTFERERYSLLGFRNTRYRTSSSIRYCILSSVSSYHADVCENFLATKADRSGGSRMLPQIPPDAMHLCGEGEQCGSGSKGLPPRGWELADLVFGAGNTLQHMGVQDRAFSRAT